MVKYYYDKYTSAGNEWSEPGINETQGGGITYTGWATRYKNATWNRATKKWDLSALWTETDIPVGSVSYDAYSDPQLLRKLTLIGGSLHSYEPGRQQTISQDNYRSSDSVFLPYRRGSLVQSNVVAEDGAYPVDGRFASDGYWYVRKTVANTAPSTPGAFTQPTGTLETGDARVISWGASSDAEGNLSKYVLEAAIGPAGWVVLAQPTTPTFTYAVPATTSITFRVKAVDAAGLESAYTQGPTLTVTKPMYYWNKYNADSQTFYNNDAPWVAGLDAAPKFSGFWRNFVFDNVTNTYSGTGGGWQDGDSVSLGDVCYQLIAGASFVTRYTSNRSQQAPASQQTTANRHIKERVNNTISTTYSRGALVQSGIVAAEGSYPLDGRHTDGFWYVRGSRVNLSIAPPTAITIPATGSVLLPNQSFNVTFGASPAPALSAYEVQSRYNSGAWVNVGSHTAALTRTFIVTTDKLLKTVEFRVRAKNTGNIYSDYVHSEVFVIEHNALPVVAFNTTSGKTLYENDSITLEGNATDKNAGDVVIIYYQIDGGSTKAITTGLSDGVTAIPFLKTLTFKKGQLLEGDVVIADALSDGVEHTVRVWAEDNAGGKGESKTITFFVVANRAPSIVIDPYTPESDLINSDQMTITGTSVDPEGQDVIARYNINGGTFNEFHNGPPGVFQIKLLLSQLKNGENLVQIVVEDSYGFPSSKTIKIDKVFNATPLLFGVARYKQTVPVGGSNGVVAWIESMIGDLEVDMEASMILNGESEDFVDMDLDNTAPVGNGIEEKEFSLETDTAKERIAIKINLGRTSVASTAAIKKITGTLQV